jgi:hypothetical protein
VSGSNSCSQITQEFFKVFGDVFPGGVPKFVDMFVELDRKAAPPETPPRAGSFFDAARRHYAPPASNRQKLAVHLAALRRRGHMPDRDSQNGSQRRSMIALGVVAVLFVLGWILVHELYANGKIEDCVMSGRTNCVPIEIQSH